MLRFAVQFSPNLCNKVPSFLRGKGDVRVPEADMRVISKKVGIHVFTVEKDVLGSPVHNVEHEGTARKTSRGTL